MLTQEMFDRMDRESYREQCIEEGLAQGREKGLAQGIESKIDLWGSLSTGGDKLPQRSLSGYLSPKSRYLSRVVIFAMYYGIINYVNTSGRALRIVAEKEYFDIDLISFCAYVEYQGL